MIETKSRNKLRQSLANLERWARSVPIFCLFAMLIFPISALATSPPTISPGAGIFAYGPNVSITAASGTIYLTTDGSEPNSSSQSYSTGFAINGTTTIKAIAIDAGVASDVTTATLVVDPTVKVLLNGTSPLLWLRSDYGVTVGDSNNVSDWADLSGNGNDATQTSSDNQPSLVAGDYNNLPALSFGSSSFLNLPSGFSYITSPYLYLVTKPTSSSNGILMDLGNGSVSNNVQASTDGASSTFTVNEGSTPGSLTASTGLNLNQYQLLGMSQASGTGSISVNGTQEASGSLSAPEVVARAENHIGVDYSGAANFYNGNILEALLFPAGTGSDLVQSYLITRYQLLTNVPAAPLLSVASSTLDGPTQVAISTPANCVCKFTTDGTTPTSESQTYNGPINIYYSQNLQAIAISNGVASSVASATYSLDSSQWPAPSGSDTTTLQINLQSPTD